MTHAGVSDLSGEENLVVSLVDAGLAVQRAIEKALLRLELSFAQQRLLAFLLHAERPLKPTTLSFLLIQATHSVSGLLNRLEDRGLVTRLRDHQDRRIVWVNLSPEGRALAEESSALVQKILASCEAHVSPLDRARMASNVTHVRDSAFQLGGVSVAKWADAKNLIRHRQDEQAKGNR